MSRKLRWAARHASGLIGITEEFRDFLLQYAGRAMQSCDGVFPLGFVDDDVFPEKDREEGRAFWRERFGIFRSEKRFTIVFIGSLNQMVRAPFDHVRLAARRTHTQGGGVRFIFCGDGDCGVELREAAKDLKNIIFTGQIGAKELWAAKELADVALLLLQRRRDYQASLSNKFFEYLTAGLPIVSHLTGVVERILRRYSCGFCFDDGEQLISILQKLRDDTELCHSMSRNARRLFCERFSAEIIYPTLVSHLERVVEA
jgi:glycosyltransferase involved in cell wall biosynthesis